MTVYIILFLFASILFFSDKNNSVIIFVSLMILTAGLRDMIGGYDVYIYGEYYEKASFLWFDSPFEYGFTVYNIILNYINGKREFLFFITAILIFLSHYLAIKKFSPLVTFSLFIYFSKFYLMSYVYLRQGLAMGIIWIGLIYLYKKKYLKFVFFLIIATSIHKSALLIIPFIFISHKKLSNIKIIIFIFISLIIAISPIGKYLIEFIGEGLKTNKLILYAEKTNSFNYFYLLEEIILLSLAIFFKKLFYKQKETIFIFNGFFMYIAFAIIGITNATFVRFSWYYLIFLVVTLPYMYLYLKNKSAYWFKFITYLYYSLLFFRLLLLYDGGDFIPYKSILQDFERNGRWEYMEYR